MLCSRSQQAQAELLSLLRSSVAAVRPVGPKQQQQRPSPLAPSQQQLQPPVVELAGQQQSPDSPCSPLLPLRLLSRRSAPPTALLQEQQHWPTRACCRRSFSCSCCRRRCLCCCSCFSKASSALLTTLRKSASLWDGSEAGYFGRQLQGSRVSAARQHQPTCRTIPVSPTT